LLHKAAAVIKLTFLRASLPLIKRFWKYR